MLEDRGNLSSPKEITNTLRLRQLSPFQSVMAAFREIGGQLVVLIHTTNTTSTVPPVVCSSVDPVVRQIIFEMMSLTENQLQ